MPSSFSEFQALFDLRVAVDAWMVALRGTFTDTSALFWWPTLITAMLGVAMVRVARRSPPDELKSIRERIQPFLRELPMDVGCYLGYTFTLALMGKALFWVTAGGATLVFLAMGMPGEPANNPPWSVRFAVALLVFVFTDFALYWCHRMFHRVKSLWWFHQLHHNPTVLTPITAFRFSPPEVAINLAAFSFGQGLALGVSNLMFGARVPQLTWLGVNVFMIVWYLAFSHLRHSHVALGYPRWLSHLLVSPWMHQAHHSIDPAHHHRNFGTALAVWDWLFGTLYIPRREETFRFGIASLADRTLR